MDAEKSDRSQQNSPRPVGGELDKAHQKGRGLQKSANDGGEIRAAPRCAGATDNVPLKPQKQQQTEQKLRISTSTISLALSTSLSTPADTPVTPGDNAHQTTSTLKRQRSLSIQETEAILMGRQSDSDDEQVDKHLAKKNRLEGQNDGTKSEKARGEHVENKQVQDEEKKEDTETDTLNEATWSVRQNLGPRGPDNRWRAHQIAEDYISLASSITLPPTYFGPFGYSSTTGQYPIEQVTALGYLTSPLRRPTVIEKWSPYEIVTFEAAITLHGKQFHQIQKWVKTKCTKDIVEFYYVWKKTSHYQRWKNQYEEEIESESSDDEDVQGEGNEGVARLPTSPGRKGRR